MNALCLLALLSYPGSQLTADAAKQQANAVITPAELRLFLEYIASDALEGRNTPSTGLNAASEFIAFNLKRFGVKPGGDNGTYFQKLKLVKSSFKADGTSILAGNRSFKLDEDFILSQGNAGSFAGPALYIPKSADGVNVEGKIVFLGSDVDFSTDRKLLKKGALVVFHDAGEGGDSWKGYVAGRKAFGGYQPEERASGEKGARGMMPHDVMAKIVGTAMSSDATTPIETEVKVSVAQNQDAVYTQNVVGIVEGSDPVLKDEYIAIGAHYDHLGMKATGSGDRIYNGADDDGSGTVSILNIAEAAGTAKEKPKRSMIFVWHCGEEKGLWGSEYFTSHPTVDKSKIVTQLNIDMVGRSKKPGDTKAANKTLTGPNDIYVIGTTMMSTRLGQIVHQTNDGYLKLGYDPQYDSPNDPNRFFFRSDHYNYAKNGIPICFWFDGEHEDYHQVSDEVSKIDFEKMSKVARTVFLTAVVVANEPTRPAVDKPLDR